MKFLEDREVFSQIIIQKPEDCISFNSLWMWPRKKPDERGWIILSIRVPSEMRFETFSESEEKRLYWGWVWDVTLHKERLPFLYAPNPMFYVRLLHYTCCTCVFGLFNYCLFRVLLKKASGARRAPDLYNVIP